MILQGLERSRTRRIVEKLPPSFSHFGFLPLSLTLAPSFSFFLRYLVLPYPCDEHNSFYEKHRYTTKNGMTKGGRSIHDPRSHVGQIADGGIFDRDT